MPVLRLISFFLDDRRRRRNFAQLRRLLSVFVLVVAIFSVIFHFLMAPEGREYGWLTGVYWTLIVMSTLGFGDITFHSDLGRAFSVAVLLSGTVFTLIQLPSRSCSFSGPRGWKRRPRQLDPGTRDQVVLTRHDPLSTALIERLVQFHYSYVLIE